jgi:hypothetical protein
MSVEEAKRTALERAKIQAIADEFGTLVSQSTSTIITNNNGESDTQFFSLGGSDVKGEWIETIGEPSFDVTFEKHFLVVKCSVHGKAKEIVSSKIEFIVKTLRNGTSLKFESTEFKDGDDMYLYFKSPESGYLSVYLLDESSQIVYCILPYRASKVSSYSIDRNKEYVLFSSKDAEKSERGSVDEYTLSCDHEKEYNTLYVLFTPYNESRSLNLKAGQEDKPNNIRLIDFSKWLAKSMSKNNNLQVLKTTITIEK